METEWVPLKYQQKKLKGWTFITFFCINSTSWCGETTLLQFAAYRFHYAANCSETTVHHLETKQLVSISSSSSSSSSSSYYYYYYYYFYYYYYYYFRKCKSCVYNCDDLLSYNSSPRSSHIWFSYIHNFIILSRVYNESEFNDLLLVGLLAQWIRALHRSRRGQGFESRTRLIFFFRLSFRNCKSCVYNCDGLLSYNSSTPQFTYFHTFITSKVSYLRSNV